MYGKPAFFGSTHCLQYISTLMTTEDVTMATTVPSHQHILTQKKFSFKIFNKTNLTKEKGGVWERIIILLSVHSANHKQACPYVKHKFVSCVIAHEIRERKTSPLG